MITFHLDTKLIIFRISVLKYFKHSLPRMGLTPKSPMYIIIPTATLCPLEIFLPFPCVKRKAQLRGHL